MTSCIATVIKNEHEYIDEWIQYHLKLGVDHIFIFEDIDSESHKEICDNYNKVTLNNIKNILNVAEINLAKEFKLTKKKNTQEIYFPKILTWIKNKNVYDWCFVIDNDEFITLENENDNIEEILSLFTDYDAFVLQWKIYGANGHIKKPNYKNKGVVDTYTKESEYPGHSVLEWTTKSCYNLKTFKETYIKSNHQPTSICKWCRTDFTSSRTSFVFDKIYLRHYMTKSWEEYVNKRKRGYFMGFARTTDMFFKINPDMIPQREELLNSLNKEILVILPYKQNGKQGNEIELALSGWKKFCQFKYHFIVIGEFDESLKKDFPWVEFIYCPSKEKKTGQYNPHLDIQNKFKVVEKMYSEIYDGFIYTCDDYYPIKPFVLEDILTTYYLMPSFTGREDQPTSYWNHDKWKTRQLLDKENLPHINYTTHFPYYMEFKKLKEIQKKFNMLEESYVFDDIYFNYFEHPDAVQVDSIRLGIWNQNIYKNEFQKAVENPNIKFICNSVEGWSKELENSLENIIKKP